MPEDGFIVLEVEGMNINANLDARTDEKGYIVLMRQNEKMDQFFDWYDNNVVHPYITSSCLENMLGCLLVTTERGSWKN